MLNLFCNIFTDLIIFGGLLVTAVVVLIGISGFIFELIDLIKMLTKHVKRWNKWRKHNSNSKFYKLMVLLGIRKSPTMQFVLIDEEIEKLTQSFNRLSIASSDLGIVLDNLQKACSDGQTDDIRQQELKELHPEWFEEVD